MSKVFATLRRIFFEETPHVKGDELHRCYMRVKRG